MFGFLVLVVYKLTWAVKPINSWAFYQATVDLHLELKPRVYKKELNPEMDLISFPFHKPKVLLIECEGWRRHSSLIFLILLFSKPNIEVSGWLYQTKTHFTHIVYQPFQECHLHPSHSMGWLHQTKIWLALKRLPSTLKFLCYVLNT